MIIDEGIKKMFKVFGDSGIYETLVITVHAHNICEKIGRGETSNQ